MMLVPIIKYSKIFQLTKYNFSTKSICRVNRDDKPEKVQYSVTVALCKYNLQVNRFLLSLTMTLFYKCSFPSSVSDDMKYTHAAF